MATPPTRVQVVSPVLGFSSTATPRVTPAFDVVNGDLLVCIGFVEDQGNTLSTPTWTGTGTWTLQQSVVIASYSPAYVWTCPVTATATGRTVSVVRSAGSLKFGFSVFQYRDHGGVGASSKTNAASGAPSLGLTTTGSNSAVEVGSTDWAAVDGTSRTWRTVNGSAMSETSYFRDAAAFSNYMGYRTDAGAAGAITVGLSAPAGQKYSIVTVEILGTTGAPALPPILVMPTIRR